MIADMVTFSKPWGDRIKGSWWKAPLIIAAYFLARLLLELEVLQIGIANSDRPLTMMDLTDPAVVMSYFSEAEWFYHLQSLGLLLAVLIMLRLFKFKLFNFKTLSWRGVGETFIIYVAFFALQQVLGYMVEVFVPNYTQPQNQDAVMAMMSQMNPVLMFVNIVVLTPLIEEIICRGLVMKYTFSLLPLVGALVAVLFFTMLHSPANVIDFLIYGVLSAGITFVYWRSRQLEYAILFHVIQNLFGFIAIYLVQ